MRYTIASLVCCCGLLSAAETAQAQYFSWNWSWGLGWNTTPYTSSYTPSYYSSYYTPTYSSYYTPTYSSYYTPAYTSYYSPLSYTAGYAPLAYTADYVPMTTYYAPAVETAACCTTTQVVARPALCCATGCTQCCPSTRTSNYREPCCEGEGTGGDYPSGRGGSGGLTTCRKCTVDDAQVFAGSRGLIYVDQDRGYLQVTWGNRLHQAELTYRRQDADFRYFEELSPPGEQPPAVPREWAVPLQATRDCLYPIWHNFNQAGTKEWSRVQLAEVRCVTPLVPETRMRPVPPDDNADDPNYQVVPKRQAVNAGWVATGPDPKLGRRMTSRDNVRPTRLTTRRAEPTTRVAANR